MSADSLLPPGAIGDYYEMGPGGWEHMAVTVTDGDWSFVDQFELEALATIAGKVSGKLLVGGTTDDPLVTGELERLVVEHQPVGLLDHPRHRGLVAGLVVVPQAQGGRGVGGGELALAEGQAQGQPLQGPGLEPDDRLDAFLLARAVELDRSEHVAVVGESERALINVGSVGQPRDGDWRASYPQAVAAAAAVWRALLRMPAQNSRHPSTSTPVEISSSLVYLW